MTLLYAISAISATSLQRFISEIVSYTRIAPSALVVIGYAASFYCLSKVLNQIPTSIAYAIWSGAGVALVGFMNRYHFYRHFLA